MLNWLKTEKLKPVWTAVRVRGNSNGFKYRHADGTMRRAEPDEVVQVDQETLAAVMHRVDIVLK
jgi:hypothetical protein